eukprot:m.587755 g.587755  ORF g.587755 m.587755 type:complete len:201 (-) comp57988_c1_seq2:1308-1910(-)
MMGDEADYLIKVVLVGDSGVGKSNLLARLTTNTFHPDTKTTIGVDFGCIMTQMNAGKTSVKTTIWDTAGQERFNAVVPSYYKKANGVLLVYDITRRRSFLRLDDWLEQIRRFCQDATVCVVGNMSDRAEHRTVSEAEGRAFATRHGFQFFETSALSATNVTQAFQQLLDAIMQDMGPTVDAHEVRPCTSAVIKVGGCCAS